jgi:hypothetical protein
MPNEIRGGGKGRERRNVMGSVMGSVAKEGMG